MKRFILAVCLLAAACGSKSPTQPSETPTPSTFTLSGHVTSSTGGAVSGAGVRVNDSINSGKSVITDGSGAYAITGLMPAGFTVIASATNYSPLGQGVNLNSNQTLDFVLVPIPLFLRAGVGDTVFDMPTTVRRITITGTYTKNSSNFIVHIGGDHLVNELLGTAWGQTHFSGTYLTTGGIVEITHSSGVSWTFTEVR